MSTVLTEPSNPTSTSVAATPFDNYDLDSDIILLSKDAVYFYVHMLLISKASDAFKGLINLPQTKSPALDADIADSHKDEIKDGLHVIRMQDTSAELNMLLGFIYPSTLCPGSPSLDTVEEMKRAITIAAKYDIDVVRHAVIRRLRGEGPIPQPERVFAFVSRHGVGEKEIMMAAAQRTLEHPNPTSEFPELQDTSGLPAVVRLMRYQQECRDAVRNVVTDLAWAPPVNPCRFCSRRTNTDIVFRNGPDNAPGYWQDYMNRVIAQLHVRPWHGIVREPHIVSMALLKVTPCNTCLPQTPIIIAALDQYSKALAGEIRRRVDSVDICL
ncbi:hypothetical protein FA95DRAFT_1602368 [Auriscalpium vulgare]|uniref:Uncharacterized protein n=1 Tax=Auriscalpium vulgare TaxID=40419 RepID=A0ACB8S6K7_9AGAM|nr:hypothetical protein FA95DRAFT_1602368 [Auriscalpium vulgare]